MVRHAHDRFPYFGRALAASLVIHVFFAVLLPTWRGTQSVSRQPVESVSFARLTHVQMAVPRKSASTIVTMQHVRPKKKATVSRPPTELRADVPHAPRHRPKVAVAKPAFVAAMPHAKRQPHQDMLVPAHTAIAVPIAAQPHATNTQAPAAAATIAPTPLPASGLHDSGGLMPLGATQDPVLAPDALAMLQHRFTVHTTLLITVGENGRTKSIRFAPPLDARTERAIQAALAQATWDAAICGGGVSCEGTATIKL